MLDSLPDYFPQLLALVSLVGGFGSWLVARLTARRELDEKLVETAMTMLGPLEERVAALEGENARLRDRVKALESENVALQAEVNELRAENAELRQMTAKPPRKAKETRNDGSSK